MNGSIARLAIIAGLTALCVGCSTYDIIGWTALLLHGHAALPDFEESSNIVGHIVDNFSFSEESKSLPGRKPVYCNPGTGGGLFGALPNTVNVYTVVDKTKQDEIISLLRRYKATHVTRPIVIQFYREEKWITWTNTDGSWGGRRGDEELLRQVRIK